MTKHQRQRLQYAQGVLQALGQDLRTLNHLHVLGMAHAAIQEALDAPESTVEYGDMAPRSLLKETARHIPAEATRLRHECQRWLAPVRSNLPLVERVR